MLERKIGEKKSKIGSSLPRVLWYGSQDIFSNTKLNGRIYYSLYFHEIDTIATGSSHDTLKLWEIHNFIFTSVSEIHEMHKNWKLCLMNTRLCTVLNALWYVLSSQQAISSVRKWMHKDLIINYNWLYYICTILVVLINFWVSLTSYHITNQHWQETVSSITYTTGMVKLAAIIFSSIDGNCLFKSSQNS